MRQIAGSIQGFMKYKNLLYELVTRDIKVRYRRSVLGVLWTILNPILMMIVMTIVFSTLFRFEIEHFPIYFFCGKCTICQSCRFLLVFFTSSFYNKYIIVTIQDTPPTH